MRLRRALASLALACVVGLACASRQAMLHPHWSEVQHVSPPLRDEDARLVLHVPDYEAGRVLLGLEQEPLRLSHEVTVLHLPADKYEFALGFLGGGRSVGMSFPVELGGAATRYYRVELPIGGERNIRIQEHSREELVAGFVRRDPFIRSYVKVTGAFRRVFLRRESGR
jgi:hypothetical protein